MNRSLPVAGTLLSMSYPSFSNSRSVGSNPSRRSMSMMMARARGTGLRVGRPGRRPRASPARRRDQYDGDHEQPPEDHRWQRRHLGFELQVSQPLLQTPLQVVGALARLARVESGVRRASLFLELELCGTVVPIGDLLGQTVLHAHIHCQARPSVQGLTGTIESDTSTSSLLARVSSIRTRSASGSSCIGALAPRTISTTGSTSSISTLHGTMRPTAVRKLVGPTGSSPPSGTPRPFGTCATSRHSASPLNAGFFIRGRTIQI